MKMFASSLFEEGVGVGNCRTNSLRVGESTSDAARILIMFLPPNAPSEPRASAPRCCVACMGLLSDELVVVSMASDPEPRDSILDVGANGTPVKTDTS